MITLVTSALLFVSASAATATLPDHLAPDNDQIVGGLSAPTTNTTSTSEWWESLVWTVVNPNPTFLKWETNQSHNLDNVTYRIFVGYLQVPWVYDPAYGAANLTLKLRITAIMQEVRPSLLPIHACM